MMNAMCYDPEDVPAFKRERAAKGQKILNQLWCLKATMRQLPVKTHTDAQARGNPPQRDRYHQCGPIEHKERRQSTKMKQSNKNGGVPVNPFRLFLNNSFVAHCELFVFFHAVNTTLNLEINIQMKCSALRATTHTTQSYCVFDI
jgi:hypothetical protein